MQVPQMQAQVRELGARVDFVESARDRVRVEGFSAGQDLSLADHGLAEGWILFLYFYVHFAAAAADAVDDVFLPPVALLRVGLHASSPMPTARP